MRRTRIEDPYYGLSDGGSTGSRSGTLHLATAQFHRDYLKEIDASVHYCQSISLFFKFYSQFILSCSKLLHVSVRLPTTEKENPRTIATHSSNPPFSWSTLPLALPRSPKLEITTSAADTSTCARSNHGSTTPRQSNSKHLSSPVRAIDRRICFVCHNHSPNHDDCRHHHPPQ